MFDFDHSHIIQFRDMYKMFYNNDATKKAYRQGNIATTWHLGNRRFYFSFLIYGPWAFESR